MKEEEEEGEEDIDPIWVRNFFRVDLDRN